MSTFAVLHELHALPGILLNALFYAQRDAQWLHSSRGLAALHATYHLMSRIQLIHFVDACGVSQMRAGSIVAQT